jgi:valyl-tRNA synthetase
MVALTPLGQDVLFDAKKTELGRNFANKIWNAARFLLLNLEDYDPNAPKGPVDLTDRWILSRLDRVTADVTGDVDLDRFSEGAWALYDFIWKEYCDWYLEFAKPRLHGDDPAARRRAQDTALLGMRGSLALLHPLMPYVTETIWGFLPGSDGLLMRASWPKPEGREDEVAEREMAVLQAAITAVRNLRAEMNVPPGALVPAVIRAPEETGAVLRRGETYLRSLAKVGSLAVAADAAKPRHAASAVAPGLEVFLPLEGLVNLEAERARLEKKRMEVTKGLAGIDAKLGNAEFTARAPAEVVKSERERRERLAADLAAVERNLASLREMD